MRTRLCLAVLFFLLAVSPVRGAPPAVAEITSPQGVKAWLVEDHRLPLVTIKFAFRGGVETDPQDKQGLAVLATSLLTQGAGPYDDRAFQERLAERAIEFGLNAGRDYIEGHLKTLTRVRTDAFALARLALTAPRFDQEPLERLRQQQITSIRFQLSDPSWQGRYALYSALFGAHPYGYRSLGTEQSLLAITRDDARDFIRSHVAKDNLFVAVAGAISPQELARALDIVFGGLPDTADVRPVPAFVWPETPVFLQVERAGTQTESLSAGPMLGREHADWYAAQVANYTLGGGGLTSRLMEEVRIKSGLTYGISTHLAPMAATSLLIGGYSADNDKIKTADTVLRETWARYWEQGPTEAELRAAKDYLIGAGALALNSTEDVAAMLLLMQQKDLGKEYLEKRDAYIEAVTMADVRRVLRNWFDLSRQSFVYVGMPEGLPAMDKRQPALR